MFHGGRPLSLRGSLKALEADIHHANTLAHAIHRAYGGACVQMRLSYSSMAPIILNLIQWMDCSCSLSYTLPSYLGLLEVLVYKVYVDEDASISTIERRASLKEFYAIIYPFLQQLEGNLMDKDCKEKGWCMEAGGGRKLVVDDDREDECGICLETCTKMVLPNCNHAMCINCYRDCWQIMLDCLCTKDVICQSLCAKRSTCQVVIIILNQPDAVIRNLAKVNSYIASDWIMDILNRIVYSRLAIDASVL
ncbi:unnamed protein product [Urochloa decumbens]|uniref:RING-type domain-containing protein n=1 Tax=Urochloa decumbens TaxID=240449 RepID=A0ABC8ZEW8_9POAL